MSTFLESGAWLELRGERWRLARSQRHGSYTLLTLEGRDRGNFGERLRVLEPFDRPRPAACARLRRRSRQAVLKAARVAMATARPADGLWTAARAAIDVWPYQLEPALSVVAGSTRLLLADGVGLGKTIQAGLILTELIERGWVERALIVCPAGLRDTWARELRDRFGLRPTVIDQPFLAGRTASMPPGVNPWSGVSIAIVSIDFLKRTEILAALDDQPIDLLIVDEAHHLVPGTDRAAAVTRVALRAPWCVCVSATPHSGDAAAFACLTAIGSTGDPLSIFRRTRRDVGLPETRRTHLLRVTPTDQERALLEAVEHYALAIWRARGIQDASVRLVAVTLARRAASSPAAIARSLARRAALLATTITDNRQSPLPWEEDDAGDDLEPDAVLGARGLALAGDERAALEHLVALAHRCRHCSKLDRIRRLIAAAREPVVLFTEYRDTLEYLVASLSERWQVAAIHGGLTRDGRLASINAFNGGGVDVLVATDAAGEGLNLHHRCRLVIDVELPWSPLRLEQRVGRVDRLGQQRRVHAIRLFHHGSIEARVLERLDLRSRRAEHALGRSTSEGDVAASVFDGRPIASCRAIAIPSLVVAAAAAEAHRINERRRSIDAASIPARRIWAAPGNRRPSQLITVHRIGVRNTAGAPIADIVAAARIDPVGQPRHRREWRLLVSAAERRAASLHRDSLSPPERRRPQFEQRIARIRSRIARDLALRYQRSLFDGRPDADAARRHATQATLDAALERVLRTVTSPIAPGATRIELVAAWPERSR